MSLGNISSCEYAAIQKAMGILLHTKKLKCPCGHSFCTESKPKKNATKALEAKCTACQSRKRAHETDKMTEMRREADRANKASKRNCESQKQTEKRKAADRTSKASKKDKTRQKSEKQQIEPVKLAMKVRSRQKSEKQQIEP